MNEFEFLDCLRRQIGSHSHSTRLVTGIGDDASIINESPQRELIVTTDLLVEGVDFHANATPARMLGHKALAVSLSDIAAMGARPRWSFLSIGMPRDRWNGSFKDEFYEGYLALADRYAVTIAGGDISESPAVMVIDSIVLGEVDSRSAVTRSGAQPADQIYVTGKLGGAAAGLKLIEMGARVSARLSEPGAVATGLEPRAVATGSAPGAVATGSEAGAVATGSDTRSDDDSIQSLLLRQLRPDPRVGWGIVVGEQRLATSMIDISDGLSSDLHHLCKESNVGALIDSSLLPLEDDVKRLCGRRALDPLALALHGGEDFELLFTVAPENVSRLPKKVDGVPISRIGEITTANRIVKVKEKGREWDLRPEGFVHFVR